MRTTSDTRHIHHSRLASFTEWRSRHFPDIPFLFVLVFFIGLITGAAAYLLKSSIGNLSRLLTHSFSETGLNPWLIALPVAGLLLCMIFTRWGLRADISHGVRQMIGHLRQHVYTIKSSGLYSAFVASTLTLGFGGSAGSEGPIACTGAAIGSNIGRRAGMKPGMVKIMLACGAGAGIAGIFKAPVGGVLFALEVLQVEMTTMSVIALVVCCLASALTAYMLEGFTVDIAFAQATAPGADPVWGWILLLGIFCGLYSAYYNYFMKRVEQWLGKFRSPWLKAIAAGLGIGLLIFAFPALYGEGYATVGHILNGDATSILHGSILDGLDLGAWGLIITALGIIAVKCFATSATTSGGVAGDFAPTLFAGSVAGLAFALICNTLFGADISQAEFALYAMAGVMAGTIRAPLMAIFLVVEMTASYSYLLPVTVVAAISFGVIRLFNFHSFYSTKI